MPRGDSVVDDAINSAQERLDAQTETIDGVDEDTKRAAAPDSQDVEEQTDNSISDNDDTADESTTGDEPEQISDNEANAETSEVEAGQTQQATQAETVAAPAILSAESKALWSKVPADVAKALSQDLLRTQQLMSRSANESQRGKAWEARVNSDFSTAEDLHRHKAELKLAGVNDEVEELHRYRAWNTVIKSDPLTAVRSLIVEHGITPEQLSGETFSEGQEQNAYDPRVDKLEEQIKKDREEREAAARAAEAHAVTQQVNAWKATKDRYGKPRAEFAALYAPQIDAEWQTVLQEAASIGEQISLEESLTRAQDRVQDRVFKAHGINPNAPQKAALEAKAAQAAKAKAAITVASGAPRSDVVTKKPRREYRNDKEWADAKVKAAEERLGRH